MRRLALIPLFLLLAVPAWAALPVKGGEFSKDPVNLYVSKDGRSIIRVSVTLPTKCVIRGQHPRYPTTLYRKALRIRAGRFSYRKVRRFPQTGAVMTESLKGSFGPGGKTVTVTGSYTLKRPDGHCETGVRRYTAPLTGLAGPNPMQGPWTGKTKAGETVSFRIDGRRMSDITSRVTMECDDGSVEVREISGLTASIRAEDDRFTAGPRTGQVEGDVDDFVVEGSVLGELDKPGPNGAVIACQGASEFTARPQ